MQACRGVDYGAGTAYRAETARRTGTVYRTETGRRPNATRRASGSRKRNAVFLLVFVILLALGIWVYRFFGGSLFQHKADESLGWNLILVNAENAVPSGYEPELITLSNGQQVDQRIYPDLQNMFDDARKDGVQLFVRSGYRSKKEQRQVLLSKISSLKKEGYSTQDAISEAADLVAKPGTSEHELGLSVDINAEKGSSAEDVYRWLDQNAWKYGFIKRYPSDKTEETGISNEEWHYRYVGKTAAKEMKEKNYCLEEYVTYLKAQ